MTSIKRGTRMELAKRRAAAVDDVEWVIRTLLTHAEMAKGRPVNEASLRLLPSWQQCEMLAARLGAALVELGEKQ